MIILLQLLMMAREQDFYDGSRREKMERKAKMELRCCTVACARVVECARAYAKVCLLYRVTRHVAST